MEGYLNKRSRGQRLLALNSWSKRWLLIEAKHLAYYEDFDLKNDEPLNKRGTYPLNETTVKNVALPDRNKFCFQIKHPTLQPMILEAETDLLRKAWMEAVLEAGKEDSDSSRANLAEYLHLLGLPVDIQLNKEVISKSFKELSLKAHPDNGGDPQKYEKIRGAYDCLIQLIQGEEEEQKYEWVQFEVDVIKGPTSQGLGIVVAENKAKRYLEIKKVLPCLKVTWISEESGGLLKKGDVLIGIGKHDITTWPLRRVIQRVGEFRAPTGKPIHMRFRRRILKPGCTASPAVADEASVDEGGSQVFSPAKAASDWRRNTSSIDSETPGPITVDAGDSPREPVPVPESIQESRRDDAVDSHFEPPINAGPSCANLPGENGNSEQLRKDHELLLKEKQILAKEMSALRKTIIFLRQTEGTDLRSNPILKEREDEISNLRNEKDALEVEIQKIILNAEAHYMRKAISASASSPMEISRSPTSELDVQHAQEVAIAAVVALSGGKLNLNRWERKQGNSAKDKLSLFEEQLKMASLVAA